ncbi:calcium/sodium antiporter [Candidatus Gracilibacteria bacterium]|nr:calcium/sodium antiporter [Candidatus Gracilibacteria bacterium]
MDILLWGVVLVIALFGLVKSADYFTLGAEKFGLYFGMSSFIVGATIVAIGGSMPELATSLLSALDGKTSFAVDNVIGSNIANTLLIGGISAITVGTLTVKKKLIDVDLPFFFISSALFVLFISDGIFNYKEGIISLVMLVLYIFYTLSDTTDDEENANSPKEFKTIWMVYILCGIVGIFIGAKYTIESVTKLGELLDISPSIITMLAVAIGTSLPELIISVRSAMAGKHSIALGNIFGSNTFNVLAVVGVPSLFTTLTVSDSALQIGVPFFIVATLGFIFTTSDNTIQKWEGMALLILYSTFIANIIGWM